MQPSSWTPKAMLPEEPTAPSPCHKPRRQATNSPHGRPNWLSPFSPTSKLQRLALKSPRTPVRRSDRIFQREHSIFSPDVANHVLACDEHSSCKPVSWAEYKRLLTVSEEGCGYLTGYVENQFQTQWMDGLLKIREMLAEPMDEESCVFCSVEDLLFDERGRPWLAGLRQKGEFEVYNRSLRCLEHGGDSTVRLNKWMEDICEESRADRASRLS
jgi:hypothetical protein